MRELEFFRGRNHRAAIEACNAAKRKWFSRVVVLVGILAAIIVVVFIAYGGR